MYRVIILLLPTAAIVTRAAELAPGNPAAPQIDVHSVQWLGADAALRRCTELLPAMATELSDAAALYRAELEKADAEVLQTAAARGDTGKRLLETYRLALEQRASRLQYMLNTLTEGTCRSISQTWRTARTITILQNWRQVVSDPSLGSSPAQNQDRSSSTAPPN